MFKLLKLIIAVVIVAALAGAYMLSSDSAKDKAKNAASELVSSAADSAKAKATDVADKAMDKAAEKVSELADSAKASLKEKASELADSAKTKADSAKKGVKSRVGDVRRANDERMSKRR